jgi:predicted MFS family arabinose efflux permease
VVFGIVFVEGIVVLGVLTFLAPAVQSLGFSAGVAGLAAAAFGAGAVGWSRLVRPLVGRLAPARIAAVGGGFLVLGWAVPAVGVTLQAVVAAGLLLGGAWAFLHSTLQSWATQVVPADRASAVALFAALLFLGSSAGAALAAPLAGAGDFSTAFRVALLVAAPLAVVAVVARARYARAASA